MAGDIPRLSVGDFVAITNQTLEYAYPSVELEGEVASFKVNQGKFVFFDLKDEKASVGCFMMVFQLRIAVEDGMKVVITAQPKLTQWGKFSLTVRTIRPSGEGSIRKSFDLLKAKLDQEGLFAIERKRPLPAIPRHIAVISSVDAAGYADFIKILGDRWGGVVVDVAHVQVQGEAAPDQMIRALRYFNQQEQVPEVVVLIRGGGSADDLSAFNDERLVRAIAASRIPTLVGVGHEIDESLADLAADVRAATPSNAAQLVVPDRQEVIVLTRHRLAVLIPRIDRLLTEQQRAVSDCLVAALVTLDERIDQQVREVMATRRLLAQLDPQKALERGYALIRGETVVGGVLDIETKQAIIKAEVTHVKDK